LLYAIDDPGCDQEALELKLVEFSHKVLDGAHKKGITQVPRSAFKTEGKLTSKT
jgi:hypothetical protein